VLLETGRVNRKTEDGKLQVTIPYLSSVLDPDPVGSGLFAGSEAAIIILDSERIRNTLIGCKPNILLNKVSSCFFKGTLCYALNILIL